ncbi:hypothetical protein CVT24_011221 [Panaeolus cyanescens]|uniref:Uncharacterized protein n=1 Tax=Panaeolus cyanescens TaxID=181874 RepID=A0A409YGD6_9AGAR|nr:hypothetical protein CVT24_011221 [Panaeolus cyanescens]
MPPTAKYELLPTSPSPPHSPSSSRSSLSYLPPYEAVSPAGGDVEHEAVTRRPVRRRDSIPSLESDPRFRTRQVSPFARAALVAFLLFLFWLAFAMRKALWMAGIEHNNKPHPVDPSY